jgi:salicylate hydroxylase
MLLIGATTETLPSRLALYEKLRLNRASAIQHFSNAGQDEPEKIREAASKYMDADKVPSTYIMNSRPSFGARVRGELT